MPRKTYRGNVLISGNLEVGGTITPALGTEVNDDAAIIQNAAAPTKKMRFSAAGITAGQTRVLTAPDYNATLASLAGTETLTGKTLTSPKVGTAICDTGGNEIIKTPATGSAVNEFTATNAAAGGSPQLSATGDDTNISILLTPKGTGKVLAKARIADFMAAATISAASDQTYTAAQLLGGLILRNCSGGARADLLPAAADLVAAIPGCAVGTAFEFTLRNTSTAAETITVTVNTGVTISGTATVAQNNSKRWLIVVTNVTGAAEAYTAYSLGTVVH